MFKIDDIVRIKNNSSQFDNLIGVIEECDYQNKTYKLYLSPNMSIIMSEHYLELI